MALIYVPPPTPTPTPDQAYAQAIALSTMMYTQLATNHTALFNYIWYNQDGITPQQFMDEYGVDASGLFNISSQIQYFLGTINPSYVPLSPPSNININFNPDGTVTLN